MRHAVGRLAWAAQVLRFVRALASVFCIGLAACSTNPPNKSAAQVPPTEPKPYTRIVRPDTNIVELQIAVRKFVPVRHRGPAIWLVGTSHIGDPNYYRALQKLLDAQNLVVFEGINAEAHKRRVGEIEKPAPATGDAAEHGLPEKGSAAEGPSLQATMAKSLGLVFQLDAIDYDRTNFLNSDLSIQQIQRLLSRPVGGEGRASAPGEKGGAGNPTFDYLMQAMDESSLVGSIFKLLLQFLGSNPQLQSITRLMLIETLGQLKGDLTQAQGLPPDMKQLLQVLIEARNQHVIEDLKTEAKKAPRRGTIAVFYGTGHMDDMEKRLTRELQYRPVEETWLTAFSADQRKTGLSAGQLEALRSLVKYQMEQLR